MTTRDDALMQTAAEALAAIVDVVTTATETVAALRANRDVLLQLVREARAELAGGEGAIDVRDWIKAADAAIAHADGR